MKDHSIFPKEMIPLTIEYHYSAHSKKTHTIYRVITLALLIGVALLPFLLVEVTVKSPGILRPVTEVSILRAPSNGIVRKVLIHENDEVKKGQLLYEITSPVLEQKEHFLQEKTKEIELFQQDLDILTQPGVEALNGYSLLITPLYRQALLDYRQKISDRRMRLAKVRQDYERNQKLYEARVIAKAEWENYRFELDKADMEVRLLQQAQLSTWHQELTSYEKDAAYNHDQLAQTQRERENLNIIAPVDGAIQNVSGIYEGSPVFTNQELAKISPDTDLMADVYVSPADIGMLHAGMDVRMQISSFNYNEWGLAQGKIREISKDIQIKDNQPVFEIRCSLHPNLLTLKNGTIGKLKKGMTLQARFSITKRSLWQLLYDKADDWMNPNLKS